MGEAPLRNVHDYGITIDSTVGQMFCKAKLCGQLRSQMKFGNEEFRGRPDSDGAALGRGNYILSALLEF